MHRVHRNREEVLGVGHSNTEQLRDLWQDLADKLGKMLDIYEEQDEPSGTDVKKSDGENSGGGYLG